VDRRNNALSAALEQQRQLLTAQVVGAIVLAVLLAFCFGLLAVAPDGAAGTGHRPAG
jgi:two-component system sensor histidine kinase GlrK